MSEKTSKTVKKSSKTSKNGKTDTAIEKPVKEVKAEVKEAPKTITAIVATDRYPLNIRNTADSESNIIGQLPKEPKSRSSMSLSMASISSPISRDSSSARSSRYENPTMSRILQVDSSS